MKIQKTNDNDLVKILEIYKSSHPKWERVREFVRKQKFPKEEKEQLAGEWLDILNTIIEAYNDQHPRIKRVNGNYTTILIASHNIHDISDVVLFIKSGMASAAGFYVDR